jgi:hypothetical protein
VSPLILIPAGGLSRQLAVASGRRFKSAQSCGVQGILRAVDPSNNKQTINNEQQAKLTPS